MKALLHTTLISILLISSSHISFSQEYTTNPPSELITNTSPETHPDYISLTEWLFTVTLAFDIPVSLLTVAAINVLHKCIKRPIEFPPIPPILTSDAPTNPIRILYDLNQLPYDPTEEDLQYLQNFIETTLHILETIPTAPPAA